MLCQICASHDRAGNELLDSMVTVKLSFDDVSMSLPPSFNKCRKILLATSEMMIKRDSPHLLQTVMPSGPVGDK